MVFLHLRRKPGNTQQELPVPVAGATEIVIPGGRHVRPILNPVSAMVCGWSGGTSIVRSSVVACSVPIWISIRPVIPVWSIIRVKWVGIHGKGARIIKAGVFFINGSAGRAEEKKNQDDGKF